MNCRFIGRMFIAFAMITLSVPLILAKITILATSSIFMIGLICGIIGALLLIVGSACIDEAQ